MYVEGQLSELRRKSVEPIAKAANVPVRSLQEFLSLLNWNEDRMRDRLQGIVAAEHASPHAVGIIDETSFAKQGEKTPGVQRQYCGHTGKTDNCIVTVHLAYAADDFHCLLDGELFLPESWDEDRERCRQAKIPDDMVYRPKWKIALELLDRANSNGVKFSWLTFDEGYGGKPPFLRALRQRKQAFIGEVPCTFTGWLDPPRVTHRPVPPSAWAWPPDAAHRQRQPAGPRSRLLAGTRSTAARPTLETLPSEGRRSRADGLGNQDVHGCMARTSRNSPNESRGCWWWPATCFTRKS